MTSVKRRKNLRCAIYKRDRGVCASCGIDCAALRKRLYLLKRANFEGWKKAWNLLVDYGFDRNCILWDADHVIPLAEGGSNDLKNMQSICRACHKLKTAEQASRKAKRRRVIGRKHSETMKLWRELGLEVK